MGEVVDLRLEEMIPELEQMQRVQLFSEQEIKEIIKRRRAFEYKLVKRSKVKEDYLKYIQYEVNLLTMIRIRREKIGYIHKKPEIDYAIANRINKLFMLVVSRFPSDIKLWLSQIEFCKRMKWYSSASRAFIRLLAVKSNDPSVWIMAAKFEFEECHLATNGRALLLRALRFHKESIPIYTEAFRLELLEADRLRKRRQVLGLSCESDLPENEDAKDEVLKGKLAVLFYNDAKNVMKSAADMLPFLTVAKEFDFTQDIQKSILSDMKNEWSTDEITWDTLARNALEKPTDNSSGQVSKLKNRLDNCFSIYEEAVDLLSTAKIWQLYVDTLFELNENELIKPKIRQRIHDVCNRALTNKHLTDKHLVDWAEMLTKDPYSGYRVKDVANEGLKMYPRNPSLWVIALKEELVKKEDVPLFQIDTGADADVDMPEADESENASMVTELPDMFWDAIKALGPSSDSFAVWDVAIEHFKTLSKTNPKAAEIIDNLYQKALNEEPPIGDHFKPLYLDWIASFKGRDEAFTFYQAKAKVPPLTLEFHYKIMDVELNHPETNLPRVRQIFENAVSQFGRKVPQIWLRYIQFELERGDATLVGNLYHRAKLELDPLPAEEFLTQHTLLRLQG